MRWPSSSASSSETTKVVKNPRPSQSNRSLPPAPGRLFNRAASTSAKAPSGRLTRNTEVQPKCWVSQPPATGPKADAIMNTAAM